MLFRDAPGAIRDEGVDSLIIDQIEMAGGTVAEHLGLPFVSTAAALPTGSSPRRARVSTCNW
jgi:zeaxanthin glucosyltransferase